MSEIRRRVLVVLVDRANYGRLKPIMQSIHDHPRLELQVVAAGTMVLERFGLPVEVVRRDGFPIDGEVYLELEGSTPTTMAKSVGFGIVEFANEFQRLKPDIVLLIGDRYEALSAAVAAAYMNICLVHIQGGEVSGSIDESARHAISKLAHYHVPSTQRAAQYLTRMGESPECILEVGCPTGDIVQSLDLTLDGRVVNDIGSGVEIDFTKPYVLVVYHPTTTTYGGEIAQMEELLKALTALSRQTVMLWPNIDAGSNNISKAIRVFRDQHGPKWLRTITNLQPEQYLRVLANASCAIGNSSSFVRDASFVGTPVVLVGDRQTGRETDANVVHVAPDCERIRRATEAQLANGHYPPSTLYGDGSVAPRVAEKLATLVPFTQKRLGYVMSGSSMGGVNGRENTWDRPGPRRVEGIEEEELSAARREATAGLHG